MVFGVEPEVHCAVTSLVAVFVNVSSAPGSSSVPDTAFLERVSVSTCGRTTIVYGTDAVSVLVADTRTCW